MEIRIGRSARACASCERDFVHEQPIHSIAVTTEEGLERQDFCADCWKQSLADRAYSTWSTRFHDPQVAEQAPPEVFSPLRQLFYEAQDSTERLDQAKAFLAAQLLRRQKVFRMVKESGESDGELRLLLFVDRIGNRLIEVRDPSFTYAEMEEGRTRLIQRLQELEATQPVEGTAHGQSTEKQAAG